MATRPPNSSAGKMQLEVKTISIEQTLVPLVSQITTLVNHKEKSVKSDRMCQALARVGQGVKQAVDQFVRVGEAISKDHPEIQTGLVDACLEARRAGENIAQLTKVGGQQVGGDGPPPDKSGMVRAARGLLSSVTRVLLLADMVVTKQLIEAKRKVSQSLLKLQQINNFTRFVQAFSQFGNEMVELAHLTGDRQNDLKDRLGSLSMGSARAILEKCTMMLLTSCKTCLRHPDCNSARETRDGVFTKMHQALEIIEAVVLDKEVNAVAYEGPELTVSDIVKQINNLLESCRVTQGDGATRAGLENLLGLLEGSIEDFTDSAYTSHEKREKILELHEGAQHHLQQLANLGISIESDHTSSSSSEQLETAIIKLNKTIQNLNKQLQETALEHASELFRMNEDHELLETLKSAGVAGDVDRVNQNSAKFGEHAEQLLETCRLLRHISGTLPLKITAEYAENSIRVLGPQVVASTHTLCLHPTSKIAKENLTVFAEAWEQQINDLSVLVKEINDVCQGKKGDKQVYLSLPRPGKHGTTLKVMKSVKLDAEEQTRIAKLGLELKLLTSELETEAEKWEEHQDDDLVKRARNMSSMAFSIHLFTRGEGALKTTDDLFTQASYFVEEGNKLYRSIKEFWQAVPATGRAASDRSQLLAGLDQLPGLCQQLHFITNSVSSGKTATFIKVMNVVQETKNILLLVGTLLVDCLTIATKLQVPLPSTGGSPHQWSSASTGLQYSGPMAAGKTKPSQNIIGNSGGIGNSGQHAVASLGALDHI